MKKGNTLGNRVGATWAGLANTDFKIQTCLSWIFPKYEEVVPIWGGHNQNTSSFLVGELVLGSLESYHCPAPAFLGEDEALPRLFHCLGKKPRGALDLAPTPFLHISGSCVCIPQHVSHRDPFPMVVQRHFRIFQPSFLFWTCSRKLLLFPPCFKIFIRA